MYKNLHIKHPDDRNRGYTIFDHLNGYMLWKCEIWQHQENGEQVTVNPATFAKMKDAKAFIDEQSKIHPASTDLYVFAYSQGDAEFKARETVKWRECSICGVKDHLFTQLYGQYYYSFCKDHKEA